MDDAHMGTFGCISWKLQHWRERGCGTYCPTPTLFFHCLHLSCSRAVLWIATMVSLESSGHVCFLVHFLGRSWNRPLIRILGRLHWRDMSFVCTDTCWIRLLSVTATCELSSSLAFSQWYPSWLVSCHSTFKLLVSVQVVRFLNIDCVCVFVGERRVEGISHLFLCMDFFGSIFSCISLGNICWIVNGSLI